MKLKQLLLCLLALLSCITAHAYDFKVNGIYYDITDANAKTVEVTNETGDSNSQSYSGDITIPSSVSYGGSTYTVTSIGSHAFFQCTGLTSINIPNSVTSIGNSAFYGCSGLTSITIPNSVTVIGYYAFQVCRGLTSINIPSSVGGIGTGAFMGCSGLTSITVESGNRNWDSRDNCNAIIRTYTNEIVFGCKNTTIPNSVTSIGANAFRGCSMTSVTIPNSVTSIGNYAFNGCSGLTSITIPESVTTIGEKAFYGCTALDLVVSLMNSPADITSHYSESKAFENHTNGVLSIPFGTKQAYIDAGWGKPGWTFVEQPTSGTCGDGLTWTLVPAARTLTISGEGVMKTYYYYNNPSGLPIAPWYEYRDRFSNVVIEEGVTHIGQQAFRGCTGVTSFTIPESVTSIGGLAFNETAWYENQPNGILYINDIAHIYKGTPSDNEEIIIQEGTKTLGQSAFSNCKTARFSITLPNSLTTIGDVAFEGCIGLSSITIPENVTTIGERAFRNCSGLTSVTIGNSVTSIGYSAFRNCTGLTSVTIPNSVTSIGNYAFSDCSGLTSVTIPDNVTTIDYRAFYNCSGLTSVTIGNGVTSIGSSAFEGCTGLTKAIYSSIEHLCSISFGNFTSNPLKISGHLFIGDQEITDLVIPSNVTSIGDYAFLGGLGITSVTISNSVTSIGRSAFNNCSNLTSVTISGNVTTIGVGAFYNCSNLTSVTVNIETPIAIDYDTFSSQANATLYVPAGSKAAYESADYWKEFGTIVEMEAPCKPITSLSELSNAKLYTLTDAAGTLMVVGNGLDCNNAILTPDHMGLVTSVSQLSSPNTDPQEGSLAALLDNDMVTFWHSNWHDGSVPAHSHYLQVELTENVNENICLQVTRRQTTSGDHITQWGVYGSNSATAADGDWEELASISMPYGSYTETLLSDPFDTKGYKYLRFYIDDTTGASNDGQTRGFGHLSEFRLFTASDIAAYQGLSDNAYCRFALLIINNKYYLYSPVKQAFWLAQGSFCPGFGSAITFSDNNASDDYRWTLTMPNNGQTVSLNMSGSPFKITPVEDFDPTEAWTAFAENVDLGLTDGYYRIRCAQEFTNTVTGTNGQESEVQVYKYMCSSIVDSNNAYGSWCTPENLSTDVSSLWKLTSQNGAFDLQNMYTKGRFTTVSKGARAEMSETSESLMALDRVTQVNGQNIFNIRVASQNIGDYYYLHMAGHNNGRGVSGELVGWCNYGVSSPTEWVLEPVSAEEAAAITSIVVGNTFTAAVPCGEGTAALTFKVTSLSPWEVEVSASPEDIAGALTIPATVQNENGIEFAVKSIGDYAFSDRNGLTSVVIPESVNNIGGSAFAGCTGLTSVTILGDLAHIWGYAFQNCTSLSDVSIHGVYEISINVFYGCSSLKSITLPEGLMYIYDSAFRHSGLESITFPSTLTTVEHEAFRGCKSLASIDFNGCSAMFDYECFRDCSSLEELYVPNTVKFQNWNMFMYCTSLKTAVFEAFEEGQETWWATTLFNECSALEEVVLPSTSVVKTGFFHMCTNLKSVTYLELADNFDVVADSYHKMYHNVPVQPLFIIPEGTAETFLHAGYMKLSDLSGLPLVREEFEAEAARIAAMADELTDGDKTALSNAISNARTAVNAAEDYATIYSQIAAIKNAAKAFLATATLSDGFEVTAAYVTNPDVDRFDFGWTVAGGDWLRGRIAESKENGDVTFNNYITVWNGVALDIQGSAISQTITNLPAGNYRLEADVIATNQNDATAEVTGVNLFAGSSMTAVATENQKPQHFTVEFTQYKDGNCNIGININNTNANWVAMDNVQLYRFSGDVPGPVVEEAVAYYIQNVETGKYLNAGNSWGTHAVLSDEGLPVNITQMPDGSYTIYFLEGSKSQQLMFRASESGVFVDYNNNSNACQYWTITPATENGTFHIQSLVTDALFGQQAYPGSYLGNNPTKEAQNESGTALGVYNDVDGNILNEEGMNITWRFVKVTPDEPEPEPLKMLYAENLSVHRGAQIELPIQLDNGEEGITAFQFDVELPEGVTLLGCALSDRKANQGNPTPAQQTDGSYRLTTLSMDNSLFSGTEGTLLYLTLKISIDVTLGNYDITLKNIELTTPNKVIEQRDTKSQLSVLDVLTGDANGDGKVSIFDAVQIVNYILGNNPSPFIFSAADLDGNGKITIFDAVSTVNIILNQGGRNQVRQVTQDELEPQ